MCVRAIVNRFELVFKKLLVQVHGSNVINFKGSVQVQVQQNYLVQFSVYSSVWFKVMTRATSVSDPGNGKARCGMNMIPNFSSQRFWNNLQVFHGTGRNVYSTVSEARCKLVCNTKYYSLPLMSIVPHNFQFQ
jgi:hypothetical protein